MPRINKSEVSTFTREGYSVQDAKWDGFTISYEQVTRDNDATESFASLPGGACQCPHWGYQISGKATYRFADRVETYEAGDFFYLAAGHIPSQEAGTEWITFSPTEPHEATQSITRRGAR